MRDHLFIRQDNDTDDFCMNRVGSTKVVDGYLLDFFDAKSSEVMMNFLLIYNHYLYAHQNKGEPNSGRLGTSHNRRFNQLQHSEPDVSDWSAIIAKGDCWDFLK